MKIYISSGVGSGNNTLSAFDAALKAANIHNYNLIKLSSVIPSGTEVVQKKWPNTEEEHGNRLYVVLAEIRTDLINHSIAAGIGWFQLPDGRGIFVEHHDMIESLNAKEAEANVAKKIETTLQDMCESRGWSFKKKDFHTLVVSTSVKSKPRCVLVSAAYKSSPFE